MTEEMEPSSKTEAAYQLLRRDILATRLMPGTSLKFSMLKEAYGLGWTPLREALSRLEAESLVTSINNRGFAVAPVSHAELKDLERARRVIEVPLLLEAIQKGGEEWESAVVTAHYRLSRCKTAVEDLTEAAADEWQERHEAFHAALVSAADSKWLLNFRAMIADQLRRHHRFLTLAPTLRAASGRLDGYEEAVLALRNAMAIENHTALMEAALDRDLARAHKLMMAHIGYTLDVYSHSGGEADEVPKRKTKPTKAGTG